MEDDDMLDAPLAEVPANLGNPKPKNKPRSFPFKNACPLYSFKRTVLLTILTAIVTLCNTQTVVVAHEKIMQAG
jgi:hypothetical protein